MRPSAKTMLLASVAAATLAVPALAESYFFRTKPLVEPPQAFSFAARSGQNPGAMVESAASPVKGHRGKTASISGGEYQVCASADCSGATWTSAPTANVPASFHARVRVTAAAFGQKASARLSVGDAAATFEVETRAKDTTPATFQFASRGDQEPNQPSYSAPVVLSDFDGAPLSVTGGGYQICASTDCSSNGGLRTDAIAEVTPGTRVRLVATPPAFGQKAIATLTVGGVSASFEATARAKDETPATIAFTDQADKTPGTFANSEIRQLREHDGVSVSVSGTTALYRICTDATCSASPSFTALAGTAARDSYVQVRQTVPTAGQPAQVATLRYGTETATFSVKAADVVAGSCGSKSVRATTTIPADFLNNAPIGSEICIGNSKNPTPAANYAVVHKSGASTYSLVATESKSGGRKSIGPFPLTASSFGLTAACGASFPLANRASTTQFGTLQGPSCTAESDGSMHVLNWCHDAMVADDGRMLSACTDTEIVRW